MITITEENQKEAEKVVDMYFNDVLILVDNEAIKCAIINRQSVLELAIETLNTDVDNGCMDWCGGVPMDDIFETYNAGANLIKAKLILKITNLTDQIEYLKSKL